MQASQPEYKNFIAIQLLRAIAAMSVVYFHNQPPLQFGIFGVDIFFVISGFVMAMVTAQHADARSFLSNRIIRIVPLYWILTTCLVFVVLIKPSLLAWTTFNVTNYLKSIFFIPYFKESGLLQPFLNVGWTLNYEMLFYVCMTTGLAISKRWHITITIGLLVVLHLTLGRFSDNPVLTEFFGNMKIFEFVLGIFAFFIYKAGLCKPIPAAVLIAACLILYCLMLSLEIFFPTAESLYTFGIPSFFLIIFSVQLESIVRASAPLTTLARSVGDSSYAIYLSHVYVFEFIRRVLVNHIDWLKHSVFLSVLCGLVGAMIVGKLIYALIDKPFHGYLKGKLNRAS